MSFKVTKLPFRLDLPFFIFPFTLWVNVWRCLLGKHQTLDLPRNCFNRLKGIFDVSFAIPLPSIFISIYWQRTHQMKLPHSRIQPFISWSAISFEGQYVGNRNCYHPHQPREGERYMQKASNLRQKSGCSSQIFWFKFFTFGYIGSLPPI